MKTEIKNPNVAGDITFLDEDGTTVLKTLAPGHSIFMETPCDEEEVEPEPPEGTLAAAMTAWASAKIAGQVPVGGPLTFLSDSGVSGGGSGRTFADVTPAHRIRQHGPVNAFDFVPSAFSIDPNNWKFKMLRFAGTDVVQTGEGAIFTKAYPAPSPAVVHRHVLGTPIAALPGDVPGVWLLNLNGLKGENGAGYSTRYASGDLTTLAAGDEAAGYTIDIRPLGPSPFLAIIGDSIAAGHGTPFYQPFLDNGIGGDPAGDPAKHLRDAIPNLTWQNFARGSSGWAYALAHVADVAAVQSRAVLVHTGVNDLARLWSAVEADMNAFKAGLWSGSKLFVDEMLPYTGGSDAENATIRTRNALTATWCAANGATLIACHDPMGQLRTSTGHLDDLKTAEDADGIHQNAAGKAALAAIWLAALNATIW
jgi:lysophospholipase L1-like esterase